MLKTTRVLWGLLLVYISWKKLASSEIVSFYKTDRPFLSHAWLHPFAIATVQHLVFKSFQNLLSLLHTLALSFIFQKKSIPSFFSVHKLHIHNIIYLCMHVAVIRYNPVIKKQSSVGRFSVIVNSVWLSYSKS